MSNSQHRNIAHFDLDCFFVSVERLKNAALVGKPIAVGGHSERGVIASCSYEARRFGVRSAMPVRLALRNCPSLIIIKGDMESYSRYSNAVTEIIQSQVELVEKSSIDEFYFDMTGMDKYHGIAKYTASLRDRITRETGLNISYALSSNKLISKIATNEAKPNGALEVPYGCEKSFLAPLAIEKMPMVGEKTARQLRSMGIETIAMLSQLPLEMLASSFNNGVELWRRAQGIDETPIVPYREQKSIGQENTFETDTIDTGFLERELARMTEQVAYELRQQNRLTGCVTVKIRYADFQTLTKQATIPYTSADHTLLTKVKELFRQLYSRRVLVRLVGVRLSHLIPGNYQIQLFDDSDEKIRLYQSIDSIKTQFGIDAVMRASGFDQQREKRLHQTDKGLRFLKGG